MSTLKLVSSIATTRFFSEALRVHMQPERSQDLVSAN